MTSQKNMPGRPKARTKGLIVEEAGSELLVYDRNNDHVHSLNGPAARIWRLCTGRRTVEQIASELDIPLDPAERKLVVRDAITKFERLGLVDAAEGAPANPSRRMWARRISIGVAAGVALPLVTSIIAPTSAYAASKLGTGATCSTSTQCASGCCCSNNSTGHHFQCETSAVCGGSCE